jgi:hypothetical protein
MMSGVVSMTIGRGISFLTASENRNNPTSPDTVRPMRATLFPP